MRAERWANQCYVMGFDHETVLLSAHQASIIAALQKLLCELSMRDCAFPVAQHLPWRWFHIMPSFKRINTHEMSNTGSVNFPHGPFDLKLPAKKTCDEFLLFILSPFLRMPPCSFYLARPIHPAQSRSVRVDLCMDHDSTRTSKIKTRTGDGGDNWARLVSGRTLLKVEKVSR